MRAAHAVFVNGTPAIRTGNRIVLVVLPAHAFAPRGKFVVGLYCARKAKVQPGTVDLGSRTSHRLECTEVASLWRGTCQPYLLKLPSAIVCYSTVWTGGLIRACCASSPTVAATASPTTEEPWKL